MTRLLRFFGFHSPQSASNAARLLAQHRIANDRERIKATTRKLREECGLAPVEALR